MAETIWWVCLEHGARGNSADDDCTYRRRYYNEHMAASTCRMVERRLAPADALVIERDENGEWPEWACAYFGSDHDPAHRMLERLAVAASQSDPVKPDDEIRSELEALRYATGEKGPISGGFIPDHPESDPVKP